MKAHFQTHGRVAWMAGVAAAGLMGMGSAASAAPFLDFEGLTEGVLVGQDGWGPFSPTTAHPDALVTENSGSYVGGMAAGSTGTGWAARIGAPGIENAGGIRADFYAFTATATVNLHLWNDINDDGTMQGHTPGTDDPPTDGVYEYGMGFGLDNGTSANRSTFMIQQTGSEGRGSGQTGMNWTPETWYRLTLTWSDVFDDNGTPSRTFNLIAEDLTNGGMLNGGNPVASSTQPNDLFNGALDGANFKLLDPTQADGIGLRASGGLIDNVTIVPVPEPTTAVLGGLGVLMLVGSRRRRGA